MFNMAKNKLTHCIWIPSIAIFALSSVASAQPVSVAHEEAQGTASVNSASLGRKTKHIQPRHTAETTTTATLATPSTTTSTTDQWGISEPFNKINALINQSTNDYGVTPSLSYEATFQGNATGGVSKTTAYAHIIEFGVNLDLNKIAEIQGASIIITGAHAAGRNLSGPQYINNTFTVSEAFVGQGVYLYQLYWQQQFAEDNLTIQIGRLNGSGFATLPAFALQVNGGINGNPTSLFLNSNFQSIPNAVWGGQFSITPQKEDYYVSAGLFQATPYAGNQHGTDFSYRSSDRILLMGEVGWTPTFNEGGKDGEGYSGTYLAGFYYSNLPQARFDGNGNITSTAGLYLMGQQTVWRSKVNSARMIDVWGGFTYSPQGQVAQMEWMGFGGIVWKGAVDGREQDQLLATMLVGTFSSAYADSVSTPLTDSPTYEMVLELSYVFNLNEYAFIQPDVQYVIRPNGVSDVRDALVFGVQFGFNF